MNYYLNVIKNYAMFSGRARRSEYWYFTLFSFLISLGLTLVDLALGMKLLQYIYSLLIIVPSIAVGVRRMHDVNKSGWFLLIPIYNLILACTAGDIGENQYGPDPKGADNSSMPGVLDR